jgi:hypothetical protein
VKGRWRSKFQVVEEDLFDERVGGDVLGRSASFLFDQDVGSLFDQELDCFRMVPLRGQHESCPSKDVGGVQIDPEFHKSSDDLDPSSSTSHHQTGHPTLEPVVQIDP